MDFSYSEEELEVIELVKQVADERLAPRSREIDESGIFSGENFQLLGELGILGVLFPEEFGGTDQGFLTYAMCVEEVSMGDFNTGLTISVHSMAASSILKFGTEAQKQKYLPGAISGKILLAFALSEPDSGSDSASIKCHAEKVDGGYLFNGSKAWVTNAPDADHIVVWATIDP
ncbi:acyl-CoA dehydrogenase family protein, partial [bacterium]|nr:acyl-CoA dehydrogenase family protein [bacterium]